MSNLMIFYLFFFLLSFCKSSTAEQFIAQKPSLNKNVFSVRFSSADLKQSPVTGLLQTLMALLSSILPKPAAPKRGKELAGPEEETPFNTVLQRALKETEGKISSSLKEANSNDKLNNELLLLAEERLKKFWYIGQCRRDYSAPCPLDWTLSGAPTEGLCIPPESYTGPCSSSVISSSSPLAKENFAWRCAVQWRCITSPPRDNNANCPETWAYIKRGVCAAPFSYRGPCTPFMDFSQYTAEERLQWAERCNAPWPAVVIKEGGAIPAVKEKAYKPLGGPVREDGTLFPVTV